ncbi:MAG: alpha/beta fold hydrolase [Paenibacillaceae bacterium]|nr:alpha/beta fold hydrolase [Paenibacillaceae bacterium]
MPIVESNGIHLHYEERGSGEPLLLIMGLGADGSLWEDHVKAYEQHFRCILMDNRGSGRSDKPEGPYDTKEMAEDAAGLLDALGIARAHVSGISMGGAIAQKLALSHPEKIHSLILNCAWDQCNNYTTRAFEMFRAMISVSDAQAFTRMLQLWIFTPDYHEHHMQDLLAREEAGNRHPHPMPVHAFQAQCDACISHRTAGRLHEIQAPTLVTAGSRDIFISPHYARRIAETIPNAELIMFEGSGHTHHWDQLEAYNEKTLQFMLRHKEAH